MFRMIITVLCCLFIVTNLCAMSMFSGTPPQENVYSYSIATGKMSSILVATDLDKKVKLLSNTELIDLLKESSEHVIEATDVSAEYISEILVKHFQMKKKVADDQLLNAKVAIVKYTTHKDSAKRWVDEWIVINKDTFNLDRKFEEADMPDEVDATPPATTTEETPAEE